MYRKAQIESKTCFCCWSSATHFSRELIPLPGLSYIPPPFPAELSRAEIGSSAIGRR